MDVELNRSAVGRPLRAAKHRRREHRAPAPSFAYKHAEMRRVGSLLRDFRVPDPVWTINDKDAAHEWADGLGIPRPALIGRYPHIGLVRWAELPDEVALKPVKGSSGHGIFLLRRQGQGWREVKGGHALTAEAVERRYRSLVDRGSVSPSVVAEELVVDPARPGLPPVDWKFYTFFGRVGLVLAKAPQLGGRERATGWRAYDGDWTDLGAAYRGHRLDRSIRVPEHADELLDLARRISSAVPRAFLRVDLYDGRSGPVFGEITPQPGGHQYFRPRVDRMLGECWEEAEARLLVRAALAGVTVPATEALPQSATLLARASA